MGMLRINNVEYNGDKYYYTQTLGKEKLCIINGENGTGKSTFSNLIYYCLGGYVSNFNKSGNRNKHIEICSDRNNCVVLEIEINDKVYRLKRYFDRNEIIVSDIAKHDLYILPINRRENYIFSDWLLEKLDIEIFDIYQGTRNFKINFTDLARLIYHDQSVDPSDIYKAIDKGSYLLDSKTIRKAIFEILMGKSFNKYYKEFAELKNIEKEKAIKKDFVDSFKNLIETIDFELIDENSYYLAERKEEISRQIHRLLIYKEEVLESHIVEDDLVSSVNESKSTLAKCEMEHYNLVRHNKVLIDERESILYLKIIAEQELESIKKILLTQQTLGIFAPDVCPYCLKKVERKENECICGGEVIEEDYQKFFYSEAEYSEILKVKGKELQSLKIAYDSCTQDIENVEKEGKESRRKIDGLQLIIIEKSNRLDNNDLDFKLEEISDKLLELKSEKYLFEQNIAIEIKRQKIEEELKEINLKYDLKKISVDKLENDVEKEILDVRELFSDTYQNYMQKVDNHCRVAQLSSNYMPIINNGEYREKSTLVPQRLMYFLTLLNISLNNDVKFPKLLIIDTPQTAGIGVEKLKLSLSKLGDFLSVEEAEFQIILTTAEGKYPDEYKKYVIENLTEDNKLLKYKDLNLDTFDAKSIVSLTEGINAFHFCIRNIESFISRIEIEILRNNEYKGIYEKINYVLGKFKDIHLKNISFVNEAIEYNKIPSDQRTDKSNPLVGVNEEVGLFEKDYSEIISILTNSDQENDFESIYKELELNHRLGAEIMHKVLMFRQSK